MLLRLLLLAVIVVLMVVVVFHADLVHSDPGIPIEDFPFIAGATAFVSFLLFSPKRWVCREIAPSVMFLVLAVGLHVWARGQYRRVSSVRVDQASVVFPGLYVPRDSLRYTFTAMVATDRPESEVAREILERLNTSGVPVAAQRIHFERPRHQTTPPVPKR